MITRVASTTFAILVLLIVTIAAYAANPCAPYCPVFGEQCRPPTRLGAIGGVLVCYCPKPVVCREEER